VNSIQFSAKSPTPMDLASLLRHFTLNSQVAQSLFKKTAIAYSSDGRFYHTFVHIGQVLGTVNFLINSGDSPLPGDNGPVLKLAAWFHDVIYEPRRDDNEIQSAGWMERELLPLRFPEHVIWAASCLIMATRNHNTSPDDRPTQILLDADLSILGAPERIYAQYAEAIRREYAFVPDDDYRAGRRTVLERFLARPQIFNSPIAFAALEKRARANMVEEIRMLSTDL
jgi:predicted metal-dependent HD superfamily phosphohydrolase